MDCKSMYVGSIPAVTSSRPAFAANHSKAPGFSTTRGPGGAPMLL